MMSIVLTVVAIMFLIWVVRMAMAIELAKGIKEGTRVFFHHLFRS